MATITITITIEVVVMVGVQTTKRQGTTRNIVNSSINTENVI
jgi:hypothetical protein